MSRGIVMLLAAVAIGVGGMLSVQLNWLPYRIVEKLEYRALGRSLQIDPVYRDKTTLFAPDAGRIVMIGDSLTGYPDWNLMLRRSDIVNFGIPGDTSGGVLGRITRRPFRGKTVFLMIGVNDLSRRIPADRVAGNIRQTVERLAAGNLVYLQSTLLTRDPALNQRIRALGEAERAICTRARCRYIDLNATIAPQGVLPAALSIDPVHLNLAAYRLWTGRIAALMPA